MWTAFYQYIYHQINEFGINILTVKCNCIDFKERLIKTFLNSVFVYDDKVVLTFNYSGDDRTITLHEIDGGLGHSICIPSAVVHHEKELLLSQELFSL